jgi:hypothetical protein
MKTPKGHEIHIVWKYVVWVAFIVRLRILNVWIRFIEFYSFVGCQPAIETYEPDTGSFEQLFHP